MFVIEKDSELSNLLFNKFSHQIKIINEDILKIDETSLFCEKVRGRKRLKHPYTQQELLIFKNLMCKIFIYKS